MRRIALGKTGMEIGRVVFGGIVVSGAEQRDADWQVADAVEAGVNYFDVAPTYGDAEQRLGPALAPHRSNCFLACKTTQRSAASAKAEIEQSFKNLQTDWFDVYQMHALNTLAEVDEAFNADGVMEVLVKAKADGLIRFIGLTSHNAEAALAALARFDFDTVMFPINWALGLGTGFEGGLPEYCAGKGIGLLGMKTLAHRKWRDGEERVYPKSWCKIIYGDDALGVNAVKYTLSRKAHAVVPPGNYDSFSFCVDHIDECIDNPLDAGGLAYLKSMLPDAGEQIFN